MNVRYFVPALTLVFSLSLSGGTKVELDQSIALCKEAMELNASQLRVDEQQRERYIEGCTQAVVGRTPRELAIRGGSNEPGQAEPKADRNIIPKVNVEYHGSSKLN